MRDMPVAARLFVVCVVVLGATAVAHGAVVMGRSEWLVALPLMGLLLLADYLDGPLRQAGGGILISVGNPVALAAVLLLGPLAAVTAVTSVVTGGKFVVRMFNAGMLALTAFIAGEVYVLLGGPLLTPGTPYEALSVLGPWLAAAITYEVVNGLLMVAVVALSKKVSPLVVWFGTLAESAFPMFVYSIFGLLLAVVWSYVGPISALLVLAPLAVARWVFQEFALRQEAYEATMRSLIKSVETKDYYTRGHSERVSKASVLIGRRSGMREDRVSTPAIRRHAARRRQARRARPTCCRPRASSPTSSSRRSSSTPYEVVRSPRTSSSSARRIDGIHLHHERIDGRGYPLGLKGVGDPGVRPDHRGRRRLRLDDHHAFLPRCATGRRGRRRAASAARAPSSTPSWSRPWSSAVIAEGWELVDTSQPSPPRRRDAVLRQ